MEPKRNIKKHTITEPKWVISQEELVRRINETASYIHNNTLNGPANWVMMGSHAAELFDEAMIDYTNDLPNVEVGDLTVEDNTYIQDITVRPTTGIENMTLDFTVLPSGGQFYDDDLTITVTGDTWSDV